MLLLFSFSKKCTMQKTSKKQSLFFCFYAIEILLNYTGNFSFLFSDNYLLRIRFGRFWEILSQKWDTILATIFSSRSESSSSTFFSRGHQSKFSSFHHIFILMKIIYYHYLRNDILETFFEYLNHILIILSNILKSQSIF